MEVAGGKQAEKADTLLERLKRLRALAENSWCIHQSGDETLPFRV